MGIAGIFLGIMLVVFLTYKGWNVIIAAPLAAVVIILMNQIPLTATFMDTFLGGAGGFVKNMFAIYVTGTVLGELYNRTGAATSIASKIISAMRGKDKNRAIGVFAAIFIIFAAGFILAMGGIHVVALTFVMLPLALSIMREADIPRVLAPALVMGCILTAVPAMPWSPGTQNVIPMQLLGTESSVGMVPGLIGATFVLALNLIYLTYTAKKMKQKGQGFNYMALDTTLEKEKMQSEQKDLPNPWLSLIPLVLIFVLFNVFKIHIVFSISIGIALAALLLMDKIKGYKNFVKILSDGASNACVVLLAGAAMGGFGALVGSLGSFQSFAASLVNFKGSAYLVVALATMIITAVSGSGPAGLGVALPMLRDTFQSMGVSLGAIHRISSFASTTLDTLPTNAIFIASSGITGVSVKSCYKYVFVCTVLNTSLATFLVTGIISMFPGLA